MRNSILSVVAILSGTPALAASGPFFSLANSDFVVLIAFVIFVGVLVYFKVPGMITGMLDDRAETIRVELDEARTLREEAQALLAEFERKQAEAKDQVDRIVTQAREEAEMIAEQAKADLVKSVARRVAAAEDQIASAEQSAVREVRDTAISVSVAAARKVLASGMDDARANSLIDTAISDVEARLH